MGDMYRDWKADRKARNLRHSDANWDIIERWMKKDESRRNFVREYSGNIQFHLPEKPKVDFYPTTEKWRKGKVIYYGNAEKFLNWYDKQ